MGQQSQQPRADQGGSQEQNEPDTEMKGAALNSQRLDFAPRGVKAAGNVGRLLTAAGEIPDRVLTSSAVRAHTTVELAVEAGGWKSPVIVVSGFYGSEPDAVIARVRDEDDDAQELIGGGMLRFPTAALARIDLDIARWSELQRDRGQLIWFVTPRFVKAAGLGKPVSPD